MEGELQIVSALPGWLRKHRPPTLITGDTRDGYMPKTAARASLRDVSDAELNLHTDSGHWLLETHLPQVTARVRKFLTAPRRTVQGGQGELSVHKGMRLRTMPDRAR